MNQDTDSPITAIIVDDEPNAREGLASQLAELSGLDIVQVCENGLQAVKAVSTLKPQLMFLDIQMPKLDGFDVLELLGDEAPCTVFVTAFDEYAVRAFEANAIDYLLKPVDAQRLQQAVEKACQRLLNVEDVQSRHKALQQSLHDNDYLQRILVRDGSDVHVLPVDAVSHIEAADDYVAIHVDDTTHIKLDRLSKLEQQLDPRLFCRIHRSCLLNINYLTRIETETKDSRIAILTSGKELPISRSGYASLKELL